MRSDYYVREAEHIVVQINNGNCSASVKQIVGIQHSEHAIQYLDNETCHDDHALLPDKVISFFTLVSSDLDLLVATDRSPAQGQQPIQFTIPVEQIVK